MNFFWSYQQLQQLYTSIKYGYLYNWWAASNPATVKYGYLYNWYAATDSRNISNTGWHVPTDTEFTTLTTYLGGLSVSGGKLKETGTTYWNSPNTGATNEVGFNGRGSGRRNTGDGMFYVLQQEETYWSSTVSYDNVAWTRTVLYNNALVSRGRFVANYGYSVRLIKDSTTLTNGQIGTYTGNDGKVYQTICIGTQEWLSENLMETKYRNGDQIPEVTDNTAWAALTTGARCSYNNTLLNAGTGNAITSSDDWVVPTRPRYETAGIQASYSSLDFKEIGTTYWDIPNTGANNSKKFNARGAGYRSNTNGTFGLLKQYGIFWTATSGTYQNCRYDTQIWYSSAGGASSKTGCSIRLLYTGSGTPTNYVGNDGKIYRIVQIGTQWWLADNLAETKYRDGSPIPVVTDSTAWAALTTGARCVYNNDESNK